MSDPLGPARLAALAARGFSGWCSFECSLSGAEPAVLQKSSALLRSLERDVSP